MLGRVTPASTPAFVPWGYVVREATPDSGKKRSPGWVELAIGNPKRNSQMKKQEIILSNYRRRNLPFPCRHQCQVTHYIACVKLSVKSLTTNYNILLDEIYYWPA